MSENENNQDNWEKNAEEFAKANEETGGYQEAKAESTPVKSLGKAKGFGDDDGKPLMADMGYKNIPMEVLPSQGMFYPPGTQIAVRAASVAEIRHWSTIDEEDLLGVDDMINYVMEKCVRIKIPSASSSWRDIKDVDRFYIIFAIREFTFKDGENKIYVNVGEGEKVEAKKEMIKYFTLHDKLMSYYDSQTRNIVLKLKNGEEIPCYIPSIGVTQFLKNYVRGKQQQGVKFDQAFVKYASFIFPDWRTLNQMTYEKAVQDSSNWSLKKLSVLSKMTDYLADGVKPELMYNTPAGLEVTAPLNIEGGIKSIFLISDIFDELV